MAEAAEEPRGGESGKKKEGSLHYAWTEGMREREEELRRLGLDTAPQRLEATPPTEIQRTESGSVWNRAGTWEDKDCSKWARSSLKARLRGFSKDVELNGIPARLRVSKVNKCSGSASLVFIRGKVCAP